MNQLFRTSVVLLLMCLWLSACSSIPTSKPLPPKVVIDSVRAVKLGFDNQQLAFSLRVNNPNTFDLPLQSLSFIASLDGTEMAHGVSTERVTIPAKDEAVIEIIVNTQINKLLRHVILATSNKAQSIAYDVKGIVKLLNWPARIPFASEGTVAYPTLK